MKAIANIPNWHRYVYGVLAALLAVFTAIAADPSILPPQLEDVHLWAPFAILVIGAVLTQLPRAQLPAGPGAPPVLSPPPKDVPDTAVPLTPAFTVPVGTFDKPPTPTLVDGHELPWQSPPPPKPPG